MRSLTFAVLLGVVGAGLVHGAVLLLLPVLGQRDAWTRFSAVAQPFATVRLDAGGANGVVIPGLDPMFMVAACRFDLTQGPLVVAANGRVPFWSASVIAPDGRNLFSLNDRVRDGGALGFVVLTPAQMAERAVVPPADGETDEPVAATAIFAEVRVDQGMVAVRAFVPDESFRGAVEAFLSSLSCSTEAVSDGG